ncbi:MAG TPA: transglycosylase SLT domain-containing protein, partial [Kofleriaceae bacterium]|nr:transglycosylase SLT domain-containing protein [Kofleriaceae bacterium]
LGKAGSSKFRSVVPWRIADCQWDLGQRQAARAVYERLLRGGAGNAEATVAAYRVALANIDRNKQTLARTQLRALLIERPMHPLIPEIEATLRRIGGDAAVALGAADRIARAKNMTGAHAWHEAVEELRRVGDGIPAATARQRDYWTGMTLFKMRRRYGDAGRILTGLYKQMGSDADFALFHGARGLSRANRDAEAITWYQRVVAEYPSSRWAPEAQFLSGWLEFNMGNYTAAIPHLERMRKKYRSSRWADEATWFLGYSHYLLGDYASALPLFEDVGKQSGRLAGGKGRYWHARTLGLLGRSDEALAEYRELVGRYPFAWYALLARARIKERGGDIEIFGDQPASAEAGTAITETVNESLARDPLIRSADELISAHLEVEASEQLRRNEKEFLGRHKHQRADALAILLDRYRRAGDFNRPWYLGIVYGRRALEAPPTGQARIWWQHAYPRAYEDLVEKWRPLGGSPPYYLFSIMHKESGFNPHTLSYADAYGLLQMIPATTKRVATALDIPYTQDLLWDAELNIKTGSWYIGHLLQKFKGQIPIGSGSFNSGPRPWMRWIDENGDRPIDEMIELVSYRQTREYAKKVTETYARYLYLYDGVVYDQPLAVDKDYVVDDLTY